MHRMFASVLALSASAVFAATPATFSGEHLNVTLISESDALVAGQRAWLGLRLQHAPHWHTYWINPGDSGLPTKLVWQLPSALRAGEIAWPAPRRFTLGELYNFGYDGDVLLPVPIEVPPDAKTGTTLHLQAAAKWLVCREECVPGKATLTVDLPVRSAAHADPDVADLFAAARAAQPQHSDMQASARLIGERVEVLLAGEAGVTDAFAATTRIVANAPPRIERRGNDAVLTFSKSDYFTSIPETLPLLLLRADALPVLVQATFAASNPP